VYDKLLKPRQSFLITLYNKVLIKLFEVFNVIFLEIEAFWEVTQFRMANSCRLFEVPYRLHTHNRRATNLRNLGNYLTIDTAMSSGKNLRK